MLDFLLLPNSIEELKLNIKKSKVALDSEQEKLKNTTLKELIKSPFIKIDIRNNKELLIRGIDYEIFFKRMKALYKEKALINLFIKTYTDRSMEKYKKKKIAKKDMKIKELYTPLFFALESSFLFNDMANVYGNGYYKRVVEKLKNETWIKKIFSEVIEEYPIDLTNLDNLKYKLKDYQLDFVKSYKTLKNRFSLDGYLLSFDQGLGKTLTAIALAECLNKEKVIIVCPNSLKENWSYEIKQYFNKYKDNDYLWKQEVFVVGNNKYSYTKNTKYLIVNLEAIDKVFPYVSSNTDNMIIVDEAHNFRNMGGKRTASLLNLKKRANCKDNLLMSGTPIKAVPNEIIPTLMMVDPMFDLECAKIYNKAFALNDVKAKEMVNSRFGIFMHRKTKEEVLQLPNKFLENLYLEVENSDRFLLKTVGKEVEELFYEIYSQRLAANRQLRDSYIAIVKQYSSASPGDTERYIKYLKGLNTIGKHNYHELDMEFFKNFPDMYVRPNIDDTNVLKRFDKLHGAFVTMEQSSKALALGQILPKRRAEMYIALYRENRDLFIERIEENPRKTVIFSMSLEVVNYISKDLEEHGIKNVKIVGGTTNRMELIQLFKQSDDVNVLIATSQTLSTGVTLTEANRMYFFGTPWRSADYDQACDRIYRIGQTSDVYIYSVLLKTEEKNLSTRMNDILEWSNKMFGSMVEGEDM